MSCSFCSCESAGSLAGSMVLAATSALDLGAMVTSRNADFPCAALMLGPIPLSASRSAHFLMQAVCRIEPSYAVGQRHCNHLRLRVSLGGRLSGVRGSHPCARKKAQGWATEVLWRIGRDSFLVVRLVLRFNP
jgi:hypothetical protein